MRLGIDLGGTKIEALALAADGAEHGRRRLPTPQGDYRATVATVALLVRQLDSELGGPWPVGVGIPGALSPTSGRVKNANSVCLIGEDLRADLQHAIGRPVRLANDANCFTLSEARDGAAAGRLCVFGVILGTGVGGGLAVAGQVLAGANAIAGEWGHNPLPWPSPDELPGPACYCGRHGCIETFLSGPGLARDYTKATALEASPQTICARADAGDGPAQESLARYCERLARALASLINIIDPDAIVLGGGLSKIASLYARIPRLWQSWVFSDAVATPLLPPRHGDSSGVRGAAWLWPQQEADHDS